MTSQLEPILLSASERAELTICASLHGRPSEHLFQGMKWHRLQTSFSLHASHVPFCDLRTGHFVIARTEDPFAKGWIPLYEGARPVRALY